MPDTMNSVLFLSVVDMMAVFGILVLLMVICLMMRIFSRSREKDTGSGEEEQPIASVEASPAIAAEDEKAVAVAQPAAVSGRPVIVTITWRERRQPASKAS